MAGLGDSTKYLGSNSGMFLLAGRGRSLLIPDFNFSISYVVLSANGVGGSLGGGQAWQSFQSSTLSLPSISNLSQRLSLPISPSCPAFIDLYQNVDCAFKDGVVLWGVLPDSKEKLCRKSHFSTPAAVGGRPKI